MACHPICRLLHSQQSADPIREFAFVNFLRSACRLRGSTEYGMKDKILAALSESGGFLSGQQLSKMLGVSRTAVWKAIGRLKEEGYEIEAVTNRGYRLVNSEAADVLNQTEIGRRLTTKWAGHPVIYEKETGSTNDDIMRMSDRGAKEGTLAVASWQTAGKGRRGRTWVSQEGGNVYMSILLRPHIPANAAPMSTLIMALAVYEALEEMYGSGTSAADAPDENRVDPDAAVPARTAVFGIKWPNDIVVSADGGPYKKFVGILTEMRMEDKEIRDVTIGIGLNLNMDAVEEPFQETATSLSLALGHSVNRAAVTAACWNHFEPAYEEFLAAGNLTPLLSRYEKGLVNRGRAVRILDPKGEFTGVAKGITPEGDLVVSPDDGTEDRMIGTGEISVRGVMGYV